MRKYNCETCNDEGWIETLVLSSNRIADETVVVEKCDECNIFINDSAAAKFALDKKNILSICNGNGFNIKIIFSFN